MQQMKKSKQKLLVQILHWFLLSLFGLTLGLQVYLWNANQIAGNRLPMPFGVGVSVVLTGSMEPEISANDLIVVKKCDSYALGDVVVYQTRTSLIVHRIVELRESEVITQGDANNAADDPVSIGQIKGKVVRVLPGVGGAVRLLKTPAGFLSTLALAVLLMVLSYRGERKQKSCSLNELREEISRIQAELNFNSSDRSDPPCQEEFRIQEHDGAQTGTNDGKGAPHDEA